MEKLLFAYRQLKAKAFDFDIYAHEFQEWIYYVGLVGDAYLALGGTQEELDNAYNPFSDEDDEN